MFSLISPRSSLKLVSLISVGLLSACAVGPDFKQPEAPKTSSYTETTLSKKLTPAPCVPSGSDQEFVEGADIEAQWWELYKSPELDALIKKRLSKIQTWAQLMQHSVPPKKTSMHKLGDSIFQQLVSAQML